MSMKRLIERLEEAKGKVSKEDSGKGVIAGIVKDSPKLDKETAEKKLLIDAILITVKANNVPVTGDLFFSLAFRTVSELKGIAKELHIKV